MQSLQVLAPCSPFHAATNETYVQFVKHVTSYAYRESWIEYAVEAYRWMGGRVGKSIETGIQNDANQNVNV